MNGYVMSEVIVYYDLVRKELERHPKQLVTAAVWFCALCNGTIDNSGGPGDGQLCEKCGADIKYGRMRYVKDE